MMRRYAFLEQWEQHLLDARLNGSTASYLASALELQRMAEWVTFLQRSQLLTPKTCKEKWSVYHVSSTQHVQPAEMEKRLVSLFAE